MGMIDLINAVLKCLPWGEVSSRTAKDIADHLIANDVVTVVRCKDCKKFYRHTQIDTDRGDCWAYGIGNLRVKRIDDFCSYGERKDNE